MQIDGIEQQLDAHHIGRFEKHAIGILAHADLVEPHRKAQSCRALGYGRLGYFDALCLALRIKRQLFEIPLQAPVLQIGLEQQGAEAEKRRKNRDSGCQAPAREAGVL